jgi:hypothetical protein
MSKDEKKNARRDVLCDEYFHREKHPLDKDMPINSWYAGYSACGRAMSADASAREQIYYVNITNLKEQNAKLEAERDIAVRKYASIELANPELTRNDHATFGDLMLERTQWQEMAEKLAKALEIYNRIMSPGSNWYPNLKEALSDYNTFLEKFRD